MAVPPGTSTTALTTSPSITLPSDIGDTSNILPIDSAARDREFVGTTAYQVTVDPELTPTGQVIIYAALSGTNGGIWGSLNTGQTWTQVLDRQRDLGRPRPECGLLLDPNQPANRTRSGDPGSPTYQGNYQIVLRSRYRGRATGVYMSTNQGQSWNLMAGAYGNPPDLSMG